MDDDLDIYRVFLYARQVAEYALIWHVKQQDDMESGKYYQELTRKEIEKLIEKMENVS